MPKLIRQSLAFTILALCASVSAGATSITPAATGPVVETATLPAERLNEVRKAIGDMVSIMKTSADQTTYIGLDKAPITEAAFYETLRTNPKFGWAMTGTVSRTSHQDVKADGGLVVRLTNDAK